MIKKAPLSPSTNSELRSEGRAQRGMADMPESPRSGMDTETFKKLDHADWLETFSKVIQLKSGVEMTPMRAGTITRLLWAAEYIRMLKLDNHALSEKLKSTTKELDNLLRNDDEVR